MHSTATPLGFHWEQQGWYGCILIFSYQISTLSHDKGELKLARLALIHFINLYVEATVNANHLTMIPVNSISTPINQFVKPLMLEWDITQLVFS